MPTTLREQLLVGIHQTERVLPRIADTTLRGTLAQELDSYLEQVRAAESDEIVEELFPLLHALNSKIANAATWR